MTTEVNDTLEQDVISGTGPYAFSFRIFSESDLTVTALAPGDVDPVTLTLNSNYTVTGVNAVAGGSITLINSTETTYAGYTIDIRSNVPRSQPTSIKNQGSFLPVLHETAFDRLSRQIQDLYRQVRQAFRYPDNVDLDAKMTSRTSWLSKYLFVNSDGEIEPASSIGSTALTQSLIGSTLYPRTAAEIAASVTPSNYAVDTTDYTNVMRYVSNTIDGVNSQRAAFQSAINIAKYSGATVTVPAPPTGGAYVLDAALDCTITSADAMSGDNNRGFVFRGEGNPLAVTNSAIARPILLIKHIGHAFDCTGSYGITFENLSVGTDSSTYPKTCFFFARNSVGGGSIHRVKNCRVYGKFSESVVYNYGAEDDQYDACQFHNIEGGANAKVMVFTSRNIRSLTSSFSTIATGNQSTLGHYINGGSLHNVSHNASADAIYLEAVDLVKIVGPHIVCADGTGGGRSFIYIDLTNAASSDMYLAAISGEVSSPNPPTYGITSSNTVRTIAGFVAQGLRLPNQTNSIFLPANVTLANSSMKRITNASIGGGINVAGTMQNCEHDNPDGGLTVGTYLNNNVLARQGEVTFQLRDGSAASGKKNWRHRSTSGLYVIANYADDETTNNGNALVATSSGSAVTDVTVGAGTSCTTTVPGPLSLTDGITAPSTVAGKAQIYVDTSDGDLKVKFGDGTVKTIVVDT